MAVAEVERLGAAQELLSVYENSDTVLSEFVIPHPTRSPEPEVSSLLNSMHVLPFAFTLCLSLGQAQEKQPPLQVPT